MKVKTNIKDNCFIVIILILMISLILNIYQNISNKKYFYELGKQNFSNIEEIRSRNESILSILDSCIVGGSVNNVVLLTLYKNYTKISEAELNLWNNYIADDNILRKFKNKSKDKVLDIKPKNEIYSEIEELLYSHIQNDMTEKIDVIDLNNYFNNFYKENCSVSESKKEKLIINKEYWIDMLKGIEEINNKYVEYSFTYENKSKN